MAIWHSLYYTLSCWLIDVRCNYYCPKVGVCKTFVRTCWRNNTEDSYKTSRYTVLVAIKRKRKTDLKCQSHFYVVALLRLIISHLTKLNLKQQGNNNSVCDLMTPPEETGKVQVAYAFKIAEQVQCVCFSP